MVTDLCAHEQRPNVIVVVADDLAQWACRPYGNTQAIQPQLHSLGGTHGVRFERAYTTCPICSPARASLLTGLMPTKHGVWDVISDGQPGMSNLNKTWVHVLHQSGYKTGLIGKWHLGESDSSHPTRFGFTHFVGWRKGPNKNYDATWEVNGQTQVLLGYTGDVCAAKASEFIVANKDFSFCLLVCPHQPHRPYQPMPNGDYQLFAQLDPILPSWNGLDAVTLKQIYREYYGACHGLDRVVSTIRQTCVDNGIYSRTYLIVTSDHGYLLGHHRARNKGNGISVAGGVDDGNLRLWNAYEESLRVPLLVRGPGLVHGTVVQQMVTHEDMFASVLELCGLPLPEWYSGMGRSWVSLARGQMPPADWRTEIYGQWNVRNRGLANMRWVVEHGGAKLVRFLGQHESDQLFMLTNDPEERVNRISDQTLTQTLNRLRNKMNTWMESLADPQRALQPDWGQQ